MDSADSKLNRREFLQKGAAVAAGGAAMSRSALSYSRIDRADGRVSRGRIEAVAARNLIVQVGTQHRSEPYQLAVRDLIRTGVLGDVTKYEIVWNYHGPRWRGRPEVKMIREQDTDWRAWLMTKPFRPFDPQLHFEFRLYKDFSIGIADQWMSHGIDLCHFFMDVNYPFSVVANGGIF